MAKPGNSRKEILQKAENIKALEQEEEAQKRRMKIRQDRDARVRAEAEKKKAGRALKLALIWIGLIVVIFFGAVWFSPDFVNWLHELVN